MSFINHSVVPENDKSSFSEFDLIEYSLTFEGRKMLANTVRFECDLRVQKNGVNLTSADDVKLDAHIGGHSFIDQITTETQKQGVLENLNEYPRYVKMLSSTTTNRNDMLNSENICELRSCDDEIVKSLLRGVITKTPNSTVNLDNDFSLKPLFCLNSVMSPDMDNSVRYDTTGTIRLSIQLNRMFGCLFGSGVDSNVSYEIKNPRIVFKSMPDDGKQSKLTMRTKLNIKSTIQSAQANLSMRVPAVCSAVSASFQQQNRENTGLYNNMNMEELPNVRELQFLFNGAQNQFVNYVIRDKEELLDRFIESFRETGHNEASLQMLKGNHSYGIGASFGEFVDLSTQNFNIQVLSDASNTLSYVVYLYFHSIISL